MALDPRRILFTQQARPLLDDEDEKGVNCRGCLFNKQRASVCKLAAEEATRRGLRDCDAVDQFGDVVIYLRVDSDTRQLDMFGGQDE